MAVAASYDQTLKFGAQTPFSDQLTFRWEGGMWEYDPYHNSIITAGNGGTKPTRTAFTIFYNQGAQRYDLEQTLQPDEQMWIDVGKLIRERVPDKNGNALPADLTMGSYEFRDLTNIGVGTLFEDKVIYDKTYGHVVYGCGGCCGYRPGAKPYYDPIGVPLSSTSSDGVNAYDTCTQFWDDVSGAFFNNWTSANHSIATVDGVGTHTGVGLGSTTSATHGYLQSTHVPNCPNANQVPGGGVDVSTPSTMYPVDDETIDCSTCSNTPLRLVTYQVVNSDNTNAQGVPIGESLQRTTPWTCQQKDPGQIATLCTAPGHTLSSGKFTDGWSVNSDGLTPAGCGYTVSSDTWQWCSTGTPKTLGVLDGYVHTDAVCINGVKSTLANKQQLPLGSTHPIPKSNPPTCP
jgi:hypothetical protein